MDWVNYDASAVLAAKRRDGVPVEPQTLLWTRGQLVQELAGLEAAMKAKGRTGVRFVSRPIDPNRASLDRVIVLINSMSQLRPENPILLRQRDDVAFAGTAELDGVTHDRFRFGSTTYWVVASGASKGNLGQVVAEFKGIEKPVTVRFTKHGPKTITPPPSEAVVDGSTIADVLQRLDQVESTK